MKATYIRTKSGEIPSTETILKLERMLRKAMAKGGFVSDVTIFSRTHIKIGMHMCSFRIDPIVHGYNADTGFIGSRCKKGFKRTTIPTWQQREDFNHMVNDCFDKLKLSARIMSGHFEVRHRTEGRRNYWSSSSAYDGGTRLFEIQNMDEVAA